MLNANGIAMFKVLFVEEGVFEMVVEKKFRVQAENGKMTNAVGPQASILKNFPLVTPSNYDILDANHMALTYRPFARRLHPRVTDRSVSFTVEGSTLTYLPTPGEFKVDPEGAVSFDQDAKGELFFRMETDDPSSLDLNSLWHCISLETSKGEQQLLRCEQVGTNIVEDIPVDRLFYAVRISDCKAVKQYAGGGSQSSKEVPAFPSQSGPGKAKMIRKKHGKADATDHEQIHTSSPIIQHL